MKRIFALILCLALMWMPILARAETIYNFIEGKLGSPVYFEDINTSMIVVNGNICDSGLMIMAIENGKAAIWVGSVKDLGPVFLEILESEKIMASSFWDFVMGDYEGYTKENAMQMYFHWDPENYLGDYLKQVSYSLPYEDKEDYINMVSFELLINEDWVGCET